MIIVVAGVSGTGKSSIGKRLSEHYQLPFLDADDFHPPANIHKMQSGQALNDDDRQPWLETLACSLYKHQQNKGCVLACSALKTSYRDILSQNDKLYIHWIMLTGSFALLQQRLSSRADHFFDGSLLHTQLDTLELPDYGLKIDVSGTQQSITQDAIQYINHHVANSNEHSD